MADLISEKYDWKKALKISRSVSDLEEIMKKFFGGELLNYFSAIDRVFARLSDPALRKLIDDGIMEELAAIKNVYARESRAKVVAPLQKNEVASPEAEDPAASRIYIYGKTQGEDVRYEVIEADEVQASHLPENGFVKNPAYTLENERLYHKEKASQDKVLKNASTLNPDFLLRDSVDANNGAPIIDQENNALGGNSRVMSLRIAWQKGGKQIETYKIALKKRAKELGIDESKIDAMKQPILVRRLKTSYSKEERQKLIASLNDTFTDSKDLRAEGKSRGDRLSSSTLAAFGRAMQDANTLRDFFDDPASGEIVDKLLKDGVIKESERNSVLSADGMLNSYGKNLIEDALRGRISQSYETLAKLSGNVVNKLDAIAPFALIAENIGGEWNITKHISSALDLIVEYQSSPFYKDKNFKAFLNSIHMITRKTPSERYSKTAIQLASMLMDGKKKSLVDRFRKYSGDAATMSESSNALFTISAKESARRNLDLVLERALNYDWRSELRKATGIGDLVNIIKSVFFSQKEYKNPASDYGLKVRGVKARERLNAKCREILARAKGPEDLSPEDRETLSQYSGRGGLTENSQWEYYTPRPLAEGVWEALKAHGFENGNVLEPSCGAGVFLGTKPAGTIMTASDIDETGSGVARLLNPEDSVVTGSFESLAVSAQDNSFDSCVGNVPFGKSRGGSISEDPEFTDIKTPQAYFILRILDKIKPGGLACLIVPTDVIDDKGATWKKRRRAISRKAEFLGAHKLPNSMFGGKGGQGTDTVVDVIVLRKHSRELLKRLEADEIPTDTLVEANVYWTEFIEGKYWRGEGKRFIMGQFVPKDPTKFRDRDRVDGKIDDASLKRNLARRFHSRINWEILNEAEPIIRNYSEGDSRFINGSQYELKDGSWTKVETEQLSTALDREKYGFGTVEELEATLNPIEGGLKISFEQALAINDLLPRALSGAQKDAINFALAQTDPATREQFYRGALLGAMISRMDAAEKDGEDVTIERTALQEAITEEISQRGHPANGAKAKASGKASRAYGLYLNAVDKNGNFSDLLAGNIERESAKGYNSGDIVSIVEFLRNEKGQNFALDDIKNLYSGEADLNTIGDLALIENIAITPEETIDTFDHYCAGDLPAKMAQLKEAIASATDARLKEKFQAQIDCMNKKIKRVPIEDITFGLQQKWFDRKYILEFLSENGYRFAEYNTYVETEDGDVENTKDTTLSNGLFSLGEGRSGFNKQFENYLNGGNVTSSKAELISEYRDRVRKLEDMFAEWMRQHIDSQELAEEYALKFNGFVRPEYSGEDLELDDILSGAIKPHSYQAAEVRRLSEEGSGICGFNVGLGKSFTALAMAAYNKKKGRANRTCVVVPSAVLENWYHEARLFYSESYMRSNVFFIGLEPVMDESGAIRRKPVLDENGQPKMDKNGEPILQDEIRFAKSKTEIYESMWKIPQSNFSLVVMTKEKFKSIPVRKETMEVYTRDMVARGLMDENEEAKLHGKSYAQASRANKLEEKYSNQGGRKKEELAYLEDMGFDSIISDESHFFKNSMRGGKRTASVHGVPNPTPSDMGIDMSIKCDYIRRKMNGRGVYGLTATPVTNSPVEIFNMLSLVCPREEFEKLGVNTVDDFISLFGRMEERERINISNEIEKCMTLVGFQNLDALRNLFHKYVNIKSVKDVGAEIRAPEGNEIEQEIELSDDQKRIYAELFKEAKSPERSIFSIMRDMERATTDIDMYNQRMTFVLPISAARKKKEILKNIDTKFSITTIDEETGKRIKAEDFFDPIFKEIGDCVELIVHEGQEASALEAIKKAGIPLADISHKISPKYAKLIENCKKHLEANGKQIVFTEEKTQHAKIVRILIHNLPIDAEQIGIINADEASGDKLDKISKAYNSGTIKIVVANKKAEVGVNLQKGTTAIHHLTLPWTPASIEQRNGRGVRQGNSVESVDVYFYFGKGSFDKYKKQILQQKGDWINELLNGTSSSGENANIAAEDEMIAMVTGNLEEYRKKKAQAAEEKRKSQQSASIKALKIVQSLINSLETLENRRKEARENAESEIENQKRRIELYKERYKSEETIKKATATFEKLEAKLAGIDKKFDEERAKHEAQLKLQRGLLREAAKKGELPFDASLIDHPEECMITLKGNLFRVGDLLQRENEALIWEIIEIDKTSNKVFIRSSQGEMLWYSPAKLEEKYQRASVSKSEFALSRLQSGQVAYRDILKTGISRNQFIENLDTIRLSHIAPCFMREKDGSLVLCESFKHRKDISYAWPDIDNEVWAKNAYIAYKSQSQSFYLTKLMSSLFGSDFESRFAKESEEKAFKNQALPDEGVDASRYLPNDGLEEILNDIWETMDDMARENGVTEQIVAGFRRGVKRRLAKQNIAPEIAAGIANSYLDQKRRAYA